MNKKANAIIYKVEKNPMQTGVKGNTDRWVIEYPQHLERTNLEFLNFVGTTDTKTQLKLMFDNKKEALLYAKNNCIDYEIINENPKQKTKPKSYASNFSFQAIKYY